MLNSWSVFINVRIYIIIIYRKFDNYFNGSSCALINFFDHTIEGENSTALPRWGGTLDIQDALQGTIQSVNKVNEGYDNTFGIPTTPQMSTYNTLKNKREAVDADFGNIELRDMLFISSKYVPTYLEQFDDRTIKGTILGRINEIYTDSMIKASNYFIEMKQPIDKINSLVGLENALGSISDQFDEIKNIIDDSSGTLTDNFTKIQDIITGIFLIIFKTFMSLFIVTCSSLITIISLYVWKRLYSLQCVITVLWNVIFFFLFITMLMGALIGIISSIGKNMAPVIDYIMSPEYMNLPDSLFGSGGGAVDKLDICLNRDGNLTNSLGESNLIGTSELSKYYNLSIVYQDIVDLMEDKDGDKISKEAIDYVEYYLLHLQEVKSKNGFTIGNMVNEIHQNCQYDFRINNGDISYVHPTDGFKYVSDVSDCNTICSDSTLDEYKQQCIYILKVKKDLTRISTNLYLLRTDLNEVVKYTNILLSQIDFPTRKIYSSLYPILGDEGLFTDLFDCSYIKYNLMMFCQQFSKKFASTSNSIAASCITGCVFCYVSLYFIQLTLYRYTPEARGKKKKKEKKPEPEKPTLNEEETTIRKNRIIVAFVNPNDEPTSNSPL